MKSFLTDDPLTEAEEIAIGKEEREFRIQSRLRAIYGAPKPPKTIIAEYPNITPHQRNDNIQDLKQDVIISDYFKIDLRNKSDKFFLNSSTYEKLCNLIRLRYGERPKYDQLSCCSITFVPQPKQVVSIFYAVGDYHNKAMFTLAGSFVADKYERKLTVSCPFVDSWFETPHIVIPWFKNEKSTGKIKQENIEIKMFLGDGTIKNTNYPWITINQQITYLITGVGDSIGFNVSFLSGLNSHARSTPAYERQYRIRNGLPPSRKSIRRQQTISTRLGRPDEVGYLIPAEDIPETDGDPLFEAFQ